MATLLLSLLATLLTWWTGLQPAQNPRFQSRPPADAIILTGAGAIRFETGTGCHYDVMWGPRPGDGRPFEGYITYDDGDSPPRVHFRRGFVYLGGRIKPGGAPHVVTEKVEITAAGTAMLVEATPRTVTVYHLAGRETSVTGFPSAKESFTTVLRGGDKAMVVLNQTGSCRECPRAFHKTDRDLIEVIEAMARMRHVRTP